MIQINTLQSVFKHFLKEHYFVTIASNSLEFVLCVFTYCLQINVRKKHFYRNSCFQSLEIVFLPLMPVTCPILLTVAALLSLFLPISKSSCDPVRRCHQLWNHEGS